MVQRDADGYADAQWGGVIVGGTWRGDPASGAYKEKETYRIRRDQGDSFEADEHALLTRFDTDADLRDEIREKIRTYALPRWTRAGRRGSERQAVCEHMLLICCAPLDLPGREASVMELVDNEACCAIIELDLKLGRK